MYCGRSEGKLRGQLELARVEGRARRSYCAARSGDAIAKVRWHLSGDKVRRTVHGENFVNVVAVEKVEGINGEVQQLLFTEVDSARQAQVNGLERVATIAVAW